MVIYYPLKKGIVMELLKIDDMQISNIDFYHAYKLNDMQVLDFRKREFKSIPELILPRSVPSTEAKIYVYEDKNKWQKYLNAIKIFYNPEKMPDKSYTIGELIRNKDSIRKTSEMDGTFHSLLDKRYELSLQQILCPEEIKNAIDLKLDSNQILTVTEFENGLFNILDKTDNDKDKTINELVNLYTRMLERINVLND